MQQLAILPTSSPSRQDKLNRARLRNLFHHPHLNSHLRWPRNLSNITWSRSMIDPTVSFISPPYEMMCVKALSIERYCSPSAVWAAGFRQTIEFRVWSSRSLMNQNAFFKLIWKTFASRISRLAYSLQTYVQVMGILHQKPYTFVRYPLDSHLSPLTASRHWK